VPLFLIGPVLKTRAEIMKQDRLRFGSIEAKKNCLVLGLLAFNMTLFCFRLYPVVRHNFYESCERTLLPKRSWGN
jgi:hypothetical protein